MVAKPRRVHGFLLAVPPAVTGCLYSVPIVLPRSSKIVNALNWRYALGELFLIVLGILIALAISDWNDRRIQQAQERALLGEVRTALKADLLEFEDRLARLRETAPLIEELSRQLKSGVPYEPAMDRLFGAAYGVFGVNLNSTAYDSLKSNGLQSISNFELRQGIARIYDHHYERVGVQDGIDVGVTLGVMRPYYLENFRDLHFLQSATPIDYGLVVSDTYFHNIVDDRLEVLRNNQLSSYPEVIGDIEGVLALLERELD